jgi:ATP-dependent Clp protease ATP-binding subunit ClpC
MFERFTEKARRTIFFARHEASQYGSPFIEAPHLILGLLRESYPTIRMVSGVDRETLQQAVAALCTKSSEVIPSSVDLPVSHACRRALAFAAEESERLGHRHIGPEHLLLGVLRENGPEAQVLAGFQIELKTVRVTFGGESGKVLLARAAAEKLLAQVPQERLEAAIRILTGLSAEYCEMSGVSPDGPFAYTFGKEPPAATT